MSVRITNLSLPVEQPESVLVEKISQRLKLTTESVQRFQILRKSLDARKRNQLLFVYTVLVEFHDESAVVRRWKNDPNIQAFVPEIFDDPIAGFAPMDERPVVVGTGPAGLLAGYYLAIRGYRPLLIERGAPVKARVPTIRAFDTGGPHDTENNYLFGEGGAGCFSDGKLTCRMTGADVDWVLRSFVTCGGRESLVYEHRPHLGSNKLPMICRNYRREIERLGGEYKFHCRLEGLHLVDGQLLGIHTSSGYIATRHVLLGMGHSARDAYSMLLASGVPMQQKAFQLGLRIEQPQAQVNQWKYGRDCYLDILGAADYSLVANGKRDLYSFCMCAGGIVIPSISEPNLFCSNGMSNSRHDTSFANSGLMVTLNPEEFGSSHPLAGVEVQRRYEAIAFELAGRDYQAPIMWAKDFVAEKSVRPGDKLPSSYERGTVATDLRQVLPLAVAQAIREGLPVMDRRWRGEFLKNATVVGPEMRGSSPVRIERDQRTRETPGFDGLYPIGEGAGYAGGIISAAVDGLRSAREIVRRFAPLSDQAR